MTSKIVTPHAAVIVWNYVDRIGAAGSQDQNDVEDIVPITTSLINIRTSKEKSTPAGSFEFHLAPTQNWVGAITPGSWCVLLMSQTIPIPDMSSSDVGNVDSKTLKMLGRIDSVRQVVDVDQETGTRHTYFVVTGQDWCSVFNSLLYVDTIFLNNNFDRNPIGNSLNLLFGNQITEWMKKQGPLPSSSEVIKALITLWGAPKPDFSLAAVKSLTDVASGGGLDKPTSDAIFSSEAQFQLPTEVAKYMRLGSTPFLPSINFSSLITLYDGILTDYDEYSKDTLDAYTFPDPASLFGMHTFWQILVDNSNTALNEMFADIRWEGTSPKLALYKRIKPFINRNDFDHSDDDEVSKHISPFSLIRKIDIPLEDAISINAGTNWRDKINFVEIRIMSQFMQPWISAQAKLDAQVIDRGSYEQDGFKPLIQPVTCLPLQGDSGISVNTVLKANKWKYLLREWYFNTHLMLNGSITIIGQDQYIQVGDNFSIPVQILGNGKINSKQSSSKSEFLIGHVEGVDHSFTVDPNTGARSFSTTIRFVRGIIGDENGNILGSSLSLSGLISAGLSSAVGSITSSTISGDPDALDGALDPSADKLSPDQSKNSNTFSSSTATDPAKPKLKGQ